jgi:hypothetical protein
MDAKKDFLVTLKEKEKELSKQLEGLRSTIELFQNGHSSNGALEVEPERSLVPAEFEDALTWNQKVLFALGKIQTGFVQDIVNELKKHMKLDEETLFKRVTGIASTLKGKKIIGGKSVGNKTKYFIK